jgi:hypothetical protein
VHENTERGKSGARVRVAENRGGTERTARLGRRALQRRREVTGDTVENSIEVHCVSITLLAPFEWSGKVLKRLEVEGLKSGVQVMGIRGGKAENLEKKG